VLLFVKNKVVMHPDNVGMLDDLPDVVLELLMNQFFLALCILALLANLDGKLLLILDPPDLIDFSESASTEEDI
jgi:hypothetical protein